MFDSSGTTRLEGGLLVDDATDRSLRVAPVQREALAAWSDLVVQREGHLRAGDGRQIRLGQLVPLLEMKALHKGVPLGVLTRQAAVALRRGGTDDLLLLLTLRGRRYRIRDGGYALALAYVTAALLRHYRTSLLAGLVVAALTGLVVAPSSSEAVLTLWAIIATAVVSYALHETAHLHAARRVTGRSTAGCLHLSAITCSVLRPRLSPREALKVSVAGPLHSAAPGVALLGLAAHQGSFILFVMSAAFLVNLLCLAPFAHDGQACLLAVRMLLRERLEDLRQATSGDSPGRTSDS